MLGGALKRQSRDVQFEMNFSDRNQIIMRGLMTSEERRRSRTVARDLKENIAYFLDS